MVKTKEMDMTQGSIFKKLIICALPLIASNLLQLLFNATDIAVIGMLVPNGDDAVAAVGSNGPLINLIIGLFVGLSVGSGVILAKYMGAGDVERANRVVGTSIFISIFIGLFLAVVGVVFSRTFLVWMKCDEDVLDMATKYLSIYFMGMPVIMLYNFLASILRSVGDNMRPLIYLTIGGALNVILNVFFITVCNLTVEGVAIATVASQAFSAVMCFIVVRKSKGYSHFSFKHFKIYKQELVEIIKIGLPSGIQSCLFSISNVLIQSSVNELGKAYMTASSVSNQFDAIVYNVGYGVALACMPFVSQNDGAGRLNRVKRTIVTSISIACVFSIISGVTVILLAEPLLKIMTKSQEIIEIAKIRLTILCSLYFMCSTMECLSYSMRALGKSTTSMVISLIGSCVLRIVWLNTIYLLNKTYAMIFIVYPITWVISITILLIFLLKLIRRKALSLNK